MNNRLMMGVTMALALVAFMALRSFAAEEKVITGEGMCAHCVLHQGTECQTVIQVKQGETTLTYFLVDNEVAKKFHGNVCAAKAKVTATGTVKEVDGKLQLTASKIELVKQ